MPRMSEKTHTDIDDLDADRNEDVLEEAERSDREHSEPEASRAPQPGLTPDPDEPPRRRPRRD